MKNIVRLVSVIALSLVIIAANMTYSNFRTTDPVPAKSEQVKSTQKVVRVLGRVNSVFDGLGVEVGFLVKDGDNLSIVRYDKGSMVDVAGYSPKYINLVTFENGKTQLDPITVEPFD